jgi:hypothetical protein
VAAARARCSPPPCRARRRRRCAGAGGRERGTTAARSYPSVAGNACGVSDKGPRSPAQVPAAVWATVAGSFRRQPAHHPPITPVHVPRRPAPCVRTLFGLVLAVTTTACLPPEPPVTAAWTRSGMAVRVWERGARTAHEGALVQLTPDSVQWHPPNPAAPERARTRCTRGCASQCARRAPSVPHSAAVPRGARWSAA